MNDYYQPIWHLANGYQAMIIHIPDTHKWNAILAHDHRALAIAVAEFDTKTDAAAYCHRWLPTIRG